MLVRLRWWSVLKYCLCSGDHPGSKRCVFKKVFMSYLLYAICCYLQSVLGQRCNAVWVQSVAFAFELLSSEPVSRSAVRHSIKY